MELCNPSVIRELLDKNGFRFSKSMGQNFLIEKWVPERIAEAAGLDESTGVLEIGPGIGTLTQELAKRAGRVCAVELDKALPPILAESLAEYGNVKIISGDILKTDLPALLSEQLPGLKPCVCANLPYNITTPVLSCLLESGLFERMTVMIQREVAHRLCAEPGTADYGAFSVYVQYHAIPECLFDVPPGCFMPAPKVTSTVLRLRQREQPPVRVDDEALFFKVVRASFAQRRKTLVNGLAAAFPLSKPELTALLQSCGMDEKVRGETLSLDGFAALSNCLGVRLTAKT